MEDSVYNQDHVFIVKDTNTGHEMKSTELIDHLLNEFR